MLLITLIAAACSSSSTSEKKPDKLVLKIEDHSIYLGDWKRYRSMKTKSEEPVDDKQLFDLFIEHQIFVYLANRDHVEVDDEDVRENLIRLGLTSAEDLKNQELLSSVLDEFRAQKWIKANISPTVHVSAEEAESYYRQNPDEFVQPETIHVREILVKDPVFVEKLHRQLQKQPIEQFLEAARKYSQAASASNDGDLGVFHKGELPEPFERAVFRLRPGEISKPVKSDLGYHLFLAEERVRAHQQRFFEVKDQIFEKILAEKENQSIRSYLDDIKKQLKIRIYPENLSGDGKS